jgi:AcrR family transcriptional regulator
MELTKDELVKLEIIQQAKLLFQRFGYGKTSMDEIALACRKAKSTIYHYFKSKDEIFTSVIYSDMAVIRKKYCESIGPNETSISKLKKYCLNYIMEMEKQANLYSIIRKEISDRIIGNALICQIKDSEKVYFRQIIKEGIEAKEFVEIPENELDLFVESLIAALFGIINYFMIENEYHDVSDRLSVFADLMFTGLCRKT